MMPAFMRIGGERALVDEDDELGTAAGAQLGVVENTASAALLNGERRKEASATVSVPQSKITQEIVKSPSVVFVYLSM